MQVSQSKSLPFLRGGGEMGELIRNFDWSASPIGSPDEWPQSLKTTLSIILHSKFPMFLFWGPEHLCFYNDAYRPSLGNIGKHPSALGMPGKKVWPEIWDFIGPMIQQILSGGPATWYEDQLVPIYRNGQIEDVYWTFSYSPVSDESGKAAGVFVTCTETTDKVIVSKNLTETNNRLEFALNSGHLGWWQLDLNNFELIASSHCKSNFGQPIDQPFSYETLVSSIHPDDVGRQEEAVKQCIANGTEYNIEYRIIWPDGSIHWINVRGQIRCDDQGKPASMAGISLDITERKFALEKIEELVHQRTSELANANQELVRINKELNRSNLHLEEFAHAASHDLKEPIRKVQVFIGKLKAELEGRSTTNADHLLSRIENASQRMGLLVEDLLVYSHVSDKPREKESIDLNEKISRIQEDLELYIEQSKAKITVGKLPAINGYRRQIQQLFQNLISNAIKYAKPNSHPEISITAETTSIDGSPFHQINVHDNGIGIEQEYQDRIFEMFARLHGRNEYEGTGIGLAIVKKVTENHDGFVRVESQPGSGATFKVFLPVLT